MLNLSVFDAFKLNNKQMKAVTGGKKTEMHCTLANGDTTNFFVESASEIGSVIDAYNSGYPNKPQYHVVGCEVPASFAQ